MNHWIRMLSLLCAGGAAIAGIAIANSEVARALKLDNMPTSVRAISVALLLLTACIVVLPNWTWWRISTRVCAVVLLMWSIWGLRVGFVGASSGELAAIALMALAWISTTLVATRGRWPAALAASAVMGLALWAALSRYWALAEIALPSAEVIDENGFTGLIAASTADRFAKIDPVLAASFATAALALLTRAWLDAPTRSLKSPRWAGLAIAVTGVALSFTAWHLLVSHEKAVVRTRMQDAAATMSELLKDEFKDILVAFDEFNDSPGPPTTPESKLAQDFDRLTSRCPSILAVEWTNPQGEVRWAATAKGIVHPGKSGLAPGVERMALIDQVRKTRQSALGGPVMLNDQLATLLLVDSPSLDGYYICVLGLEKPLQSLPDALRIGFGSELSLGPTVLAEVDLNGPADVNETAGTPIPVMDITLTLRIEPSPEMLAMWGAILPNLLLAASLVASILLGLTAYFAQTSAERAILSSQAHSQLEQLIDGSRQVAIIATDPQGIITIFNPGAERLSGYHGSDVINKLDASVLFDAKELSEMATPQQRTSAFAPLAIVAAQQRAQERDWVWHRPDGGTRRVNLAANPWKDANGELVGYMFVAVDVTEREAAMRTLDNARRKADSANRMKSSFLANVSHEIRTPMTAILGCAELLLDNENTPQERVSYAETVKRSGEHLLAVLNDILDISKIEAGRLNIELIDVRIGEIVDEAVKLMQPRAKEKSIGLVVQREGNALDSLVRTDPLRVRQILMNLVGNAIKFTAKGAVTVIVRANVDSGDSSVEIEVMDTGIGIAPDQMRFLFESFEQGDASTARRFGGTGLGLAISQRLARLLDGDITVRSEVGKGSTFSFRFSPSIVTDFVEAAPATQAEKAAPTRLDGQRVLLVDDSPDNQRLVATLLRRSGAEVEIAKNGREALEAVVRGGMLRDFDVILLDMQMPELDGYATARELRASGYHGRIVALTGNAAVDDRDRCLSAGCDDHAIKPIAREKLIAICSRAAGASA